MKTFKYTFIPLICCYLLLSGCDKYLGISPKGTQLLSTANDYDQWLNGESLLMGVAASFGEMINFLGDNVDLPNINNPATTMGELVYTWAPQFSADLNISPALWGQHYDKINKFNTVLAGIDQATGGTPTQISSLKAEALLGRALEYFYLLNEFGKPYNSATAHQDLAVPFVTSNDITQTTPPRSTVAQIFQYIVDDIQAALPNLPNDNSANRFRGSKASAYSVLARLYFYASNYPEAQKYAQLALDATRAVMIDFNGPLPATNMLGIHPDVIYGRMIIGQAPASLDFMRSFANGDLRVRSLYVSADSYAFTIRGGTSFFPAALGSVFFYTNTGTSVQEMKLIVAESAARAQDLTLALEELHEVRVNRFSPASYARFESTDQEAVIQEVLKERSHELPFHGLRWFDMRRLDQDNRMGPVHRRNAAGEIVATLEPKSDRYTLQIPLQVTMFNPNMPQNP